MASQRSRPEGRKLAAHASENVASACASIEASAERLARTEKRISDSRMRLYRELRAQGYPHGASTMMRFVAQLRRKEAAGQPVGTRARVETVPAATARHVAALMLRRPEVLTPEELAYLERLAADDATVVTVAHWCRPSRRGAGARGWTAR